MRSISIKELHRTTGEHVRRAGASKTPVIVTDHGKPIAVLASLSLVKPKRRKRVLLPGFKLLWSKGPIGTSTLDDLNEIRGER